MYNDALVKLGFVKSTTDPCIYLRKTKEGHLAIGVYVDDTVKTGPEVAVQQFNRELTELFSIKDLGLAQFIVRVQLHQGQDGISFTQSTYIKRVVEDLGLE